MNAPRGNRWGPVPWEPRFWEFVDKDGPVPERRPELGPCWVWIGYIKPNGYASFYVWNGQGSTAKRYVHRISYELHLGAIPEGLTVDHLCSRRHCVRPSHLEAVTQKVNVRRALPPRTHCPAGHEYTPENTWNPPGTNSQKCRTCHRDRQRERRRRAKEAA